MTTPPRAAEKQIIEALESLKPRLLKLKESNPQQLITPDSHIATRSTRVVVGCEARTNILFSLEKGIYKICCPLNTQFDQPEVQDILRKGVERLLRHEAKIYLSKRLLELSLQHKLPFEQVKITASRSSWGSCSSHRTISLSLYLMLVPDHLIDYVLLHELCHTVEMNHSAHFWSKLNQLCNGQSGELRNDLAAYPLAIDK